jgi:predicted dehydrogenase/nucleoside-diphosphate-sugar epimerase
MPQRPSSATPRLAIIGCGAVVEHHLLPALRRQGWAPEVFVDRSADRAALLAGRSGRRRSATVTAPDWTEVADRFDAAVVATPHATHGPLGLALLQAGKHVFMEQPLATTIAAAMAMEAAARAQRRILTVGLLRRYLHVARWTKALIESGTLGPIRRVEAREGAVFDGATRSDALLRRDLSGGGVLMDTGAHTLDLLGHWLGDLTPVTYLDDGDGGVEADCLLDFALPAGGRGRLELSRTRDLSNTARIEGARGFIEVALARNEVLAGSENALAFTHEGLSPATLTPQLVPALFDAEMRDFLRSVTGPERPSLPASAGLAAVRAIEACYAVRQPLERPWDAAPALPAGTIGPGTRVAVTGASGFVGGRLVERLVRAGAEVTCLIREIGSAARLARLPVRLVRTDLAEAGQVAAAIEGADVVFHCAYDPRSRRQNLDGTRHIVRACEAHGVRRLVYVSTFSVYEPFPDGVLTEETRDGDPSWVYVRDKLAMEAEVLAAARERRVPATIVQPSIVYGPFCKPWTNAPAEMLITGEVVLPDQGEGVCSAVYIDDLVDGMLLAATRPEAVGERFILSGPDHVTWATFYGEFARALGVRGPSFWPLDHIARANHGLMRDLTRVARNPKRVMQIIVRWPPARQALQAALDACPKPLRALVDRSYFGRGGRVFGEVFVPDPQKTALYLTRGVADSGKAQRLLGYAPRHGFAAGMQATRPYLEWAFADLRRAARRAAGTSEPPPAPLAPGIADAR